MREITYRQALNEALAEELARDPNVFSWLSEPGYVKNFAGLIQALTVGLPQYSATPTWMFFRNSVVSDLLFTGVFVLCMNLVRSSERARAASALPHTA